MKIKFSIPSITGAQLHTIFAQSIAREDVGFKLDEGQVVDKCSLSSNGSTWITYTSKFEYTILNPTENQPSEVLYNGACKGFLEQELLPNELRSETSSSVILEGSVLRRHGLSEMRHANALILVRAYGLMQKSNPQGYDPFGRACAAVEAAMAIDRVIEGFGMKKYTSSGCRAIPFEEQYPSLAGLSKDEPSVSIRCCPGGESVYVNLLIPTKWPAKEGMTYAIKKGTSWVTNIRPVVQIFI